MSLAAVLLVCAAACTTNPPPQRAEPATTPQVAPAVAATLPAEAAPAEPAAPAPPVAPPDDLPIDPAKDMAESSLTTDAKLTLDQEAHVVIDARSDIFSSQLKAADAGRGGKLPSQITLAPGGGFVQFPKVVGKAGCMADSTLNADGGDCAGGNTDLQPAGKIAGIVAHDRSLFLVGVFVASKPPKKAPARLDFSAKEKGVAFKELAPAVNQVFFVGDGKTGTGDGDVQTFRIPSGATHLYLGYADGYGFQGAPGAYGDNKGGLGVTVVQKAK